MSSTHSTTAIEFFSGIGGFAAAAQEARVEILQAFDQDQSANLVYSANFHTQPDSTNLDSIKAAKIEKADLWWLSPPCTPYSRRGAQNDLKDKRAASLVNLLGLVKDCAPQTIVIENVLGFLHSDGYRLVERTLANDDYLIHTSLLCSSDFSVPMRRPRVFVCAFKMPHNSRGVKDRGTLQKEIGWHYAERFSPGLKRARERAPLKDYILEDFDPALLLSTADLHRYQSCMDIVNLSETDRNVICFTSGYGKCFRSSGSFLEIGQDCVRRFSPREILKLLGFKQNFVLPDSISLQKQWKLVGNSLDLNCVEHVLSFIDAVRSRFN
jgi:DNA (cytosine-5)-methyltransferase 1